VFEFGPTSLKRGEEPVARLLRVVENEMGGEGECGGGGMGGA
jgi:hypothetical protein